MGILASTPGPSSPSPSRPSARIRTNQEKPTGEKSGRRGSRPEGFLRHDRPEPQFFASVQRVPKPLPPAALEPSVSSHLVPKHTMVVERNADLRALRAKPSMKLRRWHREGELVWCRIHPPIVDEQTGVKIELWPGIVNEFRLKTLALTPKPGGEAREAGSRSGDNQVTTSNEPPTGPAEHTQAQAQAISPHPPSSSHSDGITYGLRNTPIRQSTKPSPWDVRQGTSYKIQLLAISHSAVFPDEWVLPYQAYVLTPPLLDALGRIPPHQLVFDKESLQQFNPIPSSSPTPAPSSSSVASTSSMPSAPARSAEKKKASFRDAMAPYIAAVQIGVQLANYWCLTDDWEFKYVLQPIPNLAPTPGAPLTRAPSTSSSSSRLRTTTSTETPMGGGGEWGSSISAPLQSQLPKRKPTAASLQVVHSHPSQSLQEALVAAAEANAKAMLAAGVRRDDTGGSSNGGNVDGTTNSRDGAREGVQEPKLQSQSQSQSQQQPTQLQKQKQKEAPPPPPSLPLQIRAHTTLGGKADARPSGSGSTSSSSNDPFISVPASASTSIPLPVLPPNTQIKLKTRTNNADGGDDDDDGPVYTQVRFQGLWWGPERIWTDELVRLKVPRRCVAPHGADNIKVPSGPGRKAKGEWERSMKYMRAEMQQQQQQQKNGGGGGAGVGTGATHSMAVDQADLTPVEELVRRGYLTSEEDLGAWNRSMFMRLDGLFVVEDTMRGEDGQVHVRRDCRASGMLYELADDDWDDPEEGEEAEVDNTASAIAKPLATPESGQEGLYDGQKVSAGDSSAVAQPLPPPPQQQQQHPLDHVRRPNSQLSEPKSTSPFDRLPQAPEGRRFRAILPPTHEAVVPLSMLSGRYFPGILKHPLLQAEAERALNNPLDKGGVLVANHLWALEGLACGVYNSVDATFYKPSRVRMVEDADRAAFKTIKDAQGEGESEGQGQGGESMDVD